jgi:hypothetical protein
MQTAVDRGIVTHMHKHTALILAILAALFAATAIFIAGGKLRGSLMPDYYGGSESSEWSSEAWQPEPESSASSESSTTVSSAESSEYSYESSDSTAFSGGCGTSGDVNCGGSCAQGKRCTITRKGCACQ